MIFLVATVTVLIGQNRSQFQRDYKERVYGGVQAAIQAACQNLSGDQAPFMVLAGMRYEFQTSPKTFTNISLHLCLSWALDKKSAWVIHVRGGLFSTSINQNYTTQVDRLDGTCRRRLLPDGNVLVEGGNGFYEFDGTNLNQVTTASQAADAGRLLLLPNGQVLFTAGGAQIYTPASGTPNAAWAPTITSFPATVGPGATYAISPTQFNELSQAVAYGEDYQAATNRQRTWLYRPGSYWRQTCEPR